MRNIFSVCLWTVLSVVFASQALTQEMTDRQSIVRNINDVLVSQSQMQARSDTDLTLEKLLGEVLKNNPGLGAARSRVTSAKARVPQARAWDDPQVGIEFYATPITSINPLADGMETDYFLQQMIPFPGKKGLMGEAAEAKRGVKRA